MATTPPEDGMNIYVTWEVIRWFVGGLITAGLAGTAWVWRLGGRTDHLTLEIERLDMTVVDLQKQIAEFKQAVDRRLLEAEQARTALKAELLERVNEIAVRVNDLPSRSFIEVQMVQLTQRLDRIFDGKGRA